MVWKRSLVVVTAAGCLLSPLPGGRIRAAGSTAAESAAAAEDQRALLDRYCVGCHNERSLTAGLALDTADVAKAGAEPEVWERVIRKLRLNAMPPPGRPRPDAAAT
jgi:cytochrome c5